MRFPSASHSGGGLTTAVGSRHRDGRGQRAVHRGEADGSRCRQSVSAARAEGAAGVTAPLLRSCARDGVGSFVVLYAPAANFKSFLALAWALSISEGRDWLGRKVKQGPVVYVCAEGGRGFGRRPPCRAAMAVSTCTDGRALRRGHRCRYDDDPAHFWPFPTTPTRQLTAGLDRTAPRSPAAERFKALGMATSTMRPPLPLPSSTRGWGNSTVRAFAPIRNRCRRGGAHRKWRLAKARPDPVFRYCSNSNACCSPENSSETTRCQGRSAAVWCDPPELCVSSLRWRSDVMPV
jgi:hypothetical protein